MNNKLGKKQGGGGREREGGRERGRERGEREWKRGNEMKNYSP